ncbi:hypothetical protein [Nakamurella multipartita]|uniref:Uncharacterized protein n=1 Tax=Nakamurella multipartita (strain ATCC 700099 / DSM 44233 / CIP 104796 / JCM 9543 / NBRC 105858 / Y-104) TaxID=479431 RepID=C8XIQ9_NAKMY|nr:hypothetical protein [Nakamurella multipartita]ACV80524.1 hypothetical protein Namu_4235 [Nakamurella multipartita DSM 44233]
MTSGLPAAVGSAARSVFAWRRPGTVTALCPVPAARTAELRTRLAAAQPALGLDRLTGVQFATAQVVRGGWDGPCRTGRGAGRDHRAGARPHLPQHPPAGSAAPSRRVPGDIDPVGTSCACWCSTLTGAAMALVRYLEKTEPDVVIRPDDGRVAALEQAEDLDVQNQFTMIATVRDSVERRELLRATLFLSDAYSKFLANSGRLVGVETIHFARIHRLDGGRRFLFMSDFDGSWSRYLFDFLTTGSFAVVPNWTNLLGCPKTEYLMEPGPGFSQRFLPFTRAGQVRTDVWFSAYPGLTVTDILRHGQIRRGLFTDDGPPADRWVRLL